MNRVISNIDFIKVLISSLRKEFENFIRAASKDKILAIAEIILNVLNSNIESTPKEVQTLKRYKRTLRKVSRLKINIKERKRIINAHPRLFQQILKNYISKILKMIED